MAERVPWAGRTARRGSDAFCGKQIASSMTRPPVFVGQTVYWAVGGKNTALVALVSEGVLVPRAPVTKLALSSR